MSEKAWDSWKNHDDHVRRAIFRHEAEREQLQIVDDDAFHGNRTLLFRGEFLGLLAPGYIAELKLHSEANPHVTILDYGTRKLVAIITLGGLMAAEG